MLQNWIISFSLAIQKKHFFEIWSSDAVDLNIYKCIKLNDSRWYTSQILVWVYPKTGVKWNQGWKWPFSENYQSKRIYLWGEKKIIFWMSFQKFGLYNEISFGSPLEKKMQFHRMKHRRPRIKWENRHSKCSTKT